MKNELCAIQDLARLDAAVGALYNTLMARGLLGTDAQISHDYAGLCAEVALLRGDTSEQAYWEARQAKLKQRLANFSQGLTPGPTYLASHQSRG